MDQDNCREFSVLSVVNAISDQINAAAASGNRAEVVRLMSVIKGYGMDVKIGIPNDHAIMRNVNAVTFS